MQAKVKLTDAQGQEYLLLVSKINLKGILVGHIPHLDVDAPVRLELQMGHQNTPLLVQGAIHKSVTHSNGTKGTIVRFVNLSENNKTVLSQLVSSRHPSNAEFITSPSVQTQIMRAPSSEVLSTRTHKVSSRNEQTVVADAESFSKLSLKSPDRGADFVSTTLDEETLHAPHEGLAGKTMIAASIPDFSFKPKRTRKVSLKLSLALILAGIVLSRFWGSMGRFLDQKFGAPIPAAENMVPTTTPTAPEVLASPEAASSDSQLQTQAPPTSTPTYLAEMTLSENENTLTLSLRGEGSFVDVTTQESKSPKRLVLKLPSIEKLSLTESTLPVGKTPVLRVRAREDDEGFVTVTLDLYPIEFPKYQVRIEPQGLLLVIDKP